jgi:hypothetical protein
MVMPNITTSLCCCVPQGKWITIWPTYSYIFVIYRRELSYIVPCVSITSNAAVIGRSAVQEVLPNVYFLRMNSKGNKTEGPVHEKLIRNDIISNN